MHEKEELGAPTEGNYTRDKEIFMKEVKETINELITGKYPNSIKDARPPTYNI